MFTQSAKTITHRGADWDGEGREEKESGPDHHAVRGVSWGRACNVWSQKPCLTGGTRRLVHCRVSVQQNLSFTTSACCNQAPCSPDVAHGEHTEYLAISGKGVGLSHSKASVIAKPCFLFPPPWPCRFWPQTPSPPLELRVDLACQVAHMQLRNNVVSPNQTAPPSNLK